MEKHITAVAVLHIGLSILGVIIGAGLFVLLAGIGVLTQEEDAFLILGGVGTILGGLITVLSIPGIIGGLGLLKRKEWARILVLIVSAFDILNIPIGTALGIYSIWVLVQDETVRMFNPVPTGLQPAP